MYLLIYEKSNETLGIAYDHRNNIFIGTDVLEEALKMCPDDLNDMATSSDPTWRMSAGVDWLSCRQHIVGFEEYDKNTLNDLIGDCKYAENFGGFGNIRMAVPITPENQEKVRNLIVKTTKLFKDVQNKITNEG